MTRAEMLAQIELTSRQISDQREGWVAGAKWVLAQLDAPDPQPRLPPEAVMGGAEWTAAKDDPQHDVGEVPMDGNVFTSEEIERDEDEAGIHLGGIAKALTVWAAMKSRSVTVAEAILVFNTTREVIVEAVEFAQWAYLNPPQIEDPSNQTIELDGE